MLLKTAGSAAAEKMKIVIVKNIKSPLSVLYQIIRRNIFALNFEVDYLFLAIIS
jgi:hypothetical protein